MKAATSEQIKKIDKEAFDIYNIPSIILMENAGYSVYKNIIEKINVSDKKICIVCGKGNNGGDGFVVGRHLSFLCRDINIYITCSEDEIKGDSLINYNILKSMKLNIKRIEYKNIDIFKKDIIESDIIVDGIFGIGIKGEIDGLYRDIIDIINNYKKYVVAIDMPSGINSDNGKISGTAIRADMTVTFALPKIGLYVYPGKEYANDIYVEDISIPKELIEAQDINVNITDIKELNSIIKKRKKDTNKGTYGRAYIVAGSKNMMGAAVMCGLAALRTGAGLVEMGVPESIKKSIAPLLIESIVTGLDDFDGQITNASSPKLIEALKAASAYAIGPGLSKSQDLTQVLNIVIENATCPGLIDADGLNLLSDNVDILYNAKKSIILTPHPGEMARLLKKDIGYIQNDRIGSAKYLSEKYGVITVLKGAATIIAAPNSEIYINTTGNPGMAKGGSGDILTGMIVSFLAQGISPLNSARLGVFLHGLAGDIAEDKYGEYSMKATDIVEGIPLAIKKIKCEIY